MLFSSCCCCCCLPHQLLTSLYILVGMAIMGILAGAIGETLIRQVELTTSQMAMVFEDTVEFGVNAGVGTVNAAGAVVVGTASAVSSIVPSGSPRNVRTVAVPTTTSFQG